MTHVRLNFFKHAARAASLMLAAVVVAGLTSIESGSPKPAAAEEDLPIIRVSRNFTDAPRQYDLMQTLVEHSSSDQAREAAAAWLAAYDTALALGVAALEAAVHADAAYRVAATRAGLPATGRRAA